MEDYSEFLKELKRKYSDGYLVLATIEEREKFLKLFIENSHIEEEEARKFLNKTFAIQRNILFYKPYKDYVKVLESRYGKYYFALMNASEQDKLLNLYTKYMRNKYKNYTIEDAFIELFYDEYLKYQEEKEKSEKALESMELKLTKRTK